MSNYPCVVALPDARHIAVVGGSKSNSAVPYTTVYDTVYDRWNWGLVCFSFSWRFPFFRPNIFEIYRAKTNKHKTGPQLNTARMKASCAVSPSNNYLYIFGGGTYNSGSSSSDISLSSIEKIHGRSTPFFLRLSKMRLQCEKRGSRKSARKKRWGASVAC